MKMYAKIHEYCYDNRVYYNDFLEDEYYIDSFCIYGNRRFIDHTTVLFSTLVSLLDNGDLKYEIDKFQTDESSYDSMEEIINDYLPDCNIDHSQAFEIMPLIDMYIQGKEQNAIAAILSIVTGHNWNYKQLCGCCQSDWNYLYYDCTKWNKEDLERFEILYFNQGYEIEISENEDFEDSFFSYGYEWNDEKRLAEIASIANCKTSELVIMED